MRKSWISFWQEQSKPLHQFDNEEFYRKHAAELNVLTGDPAGKSVLDLGCGDGALFRHLGFNRASRYTGVDFSRGMLDAFRTKEGGLELIEGSAIDIPATGTFDLVFSNGLVQYMDLSQFTLHLEHSIKKLQPGGAYVCGSLPAKERFLPMAFGRGTYPAKFSVRSAVKEIGAYVLGRAALGQWYSLRDIETCAARAGAVASVFGSIYYLYRYHVVFRPAQSGS
jgi:cyclopropane fatty-acyl-phospholipid synthase-like methyltransferase